MKQRYMGKVVLATVVFFSSAGCAAEPAPRTPLAAVDDVQLSVFSSSTESLVLGSLYRSALDNQGRAATLDESVYTPEEALTGLREGDTDLVIGCAGDMLEIFNPSLAAELTAEFAQVNDQDAAEQREKIYDALIGSLPTTLAASDPSNAQACADSDALPQNIVPIYRKPNLAREDRNTLNWVSGAIRTDDITELVDAVESGSDVDQAVSDFISSK